jgi:hypothetical protein
MSNREIVIDLLSKLPEDVSLEEIAREIELLALVSKRLGSRPADVKAFWRRMPASSSIHGLASNSHPSVPE